ncbi:MULTISPECIES: hypothetical protein [Lacticaseibacillus]|uniref:Uncharacterized protein n=2 Tax=Lacticaseibacillus TaxID=2759736 RepID=A0ABZ0BV06_LACCA|nr:MULTISPECIES: hypothetical protein [Lacticaseibacillus]WLV80360.1 hypothetical protein LACSTY_002426 [Lacticaseibacillus sp. NCIMB 15473]WNX24321.1 hypothetical protein RWA15_11855 [Lacticaseibacillus casei]WNX27094.1 hypothetical protein RWA16_11855 [Lacticaseibacillus casei]
MLMTIVGIASSIETSSWLASLMSRVNITDFWIRIIHDEVILGIMPL